jgi:hypothetical protein
MRKMSKVIDDNLIILNKVGLHEISKMSKELNEVKRLADALTPEEQLSLIAYLSQRLQRCEITRKPRRQITEFIGIAPNMLGGMDAQEYVTRMRRGEFPDLEIAEKQLRKEYSN